MNDRDLLGAALAATQLPALRFAVVAGVAPRTVRRWQAGDSELPGPARQLCRLLIRHPQLAITLLHDPDPETP